MTFVSSLARTSSSVAARATQARARRISPRGSSGVLPSQGHHGGNRCLRRPPRPRRTTPLARRGGLTLRAADSRRFAPLAADATVRCASKEGHVSHPAPCLSKRVPCVPTLARRPHRRARLTAFHSSAPATPRLGPKTPASLRPGLPRPRPPGSDSPMRLRSSLAFLSASAHHTLSRSGSSAVPEHRGSRDAQHHGSSPTGRATVATRSCEHHQGSRGVSPVSAIRWRHSSLYPPI